MDLYDMEFGKIHGDKYKIVAEEKGVYNDMLKPLIEKHTELYTKLFNEGGEVNTGGGFQKYEDKGKEFNDRVRVYYLMDLNSTVLFMSLDYNEVQEKLKEHYEQGKKGRSGNNTVPKEDWEIGVVQPHNVRTYYVPEMKNYAKGGILNVAKELEIYENNTEDLETAYMVANGNLKSTDLRPSNNRNKLVPIFKMFIKDDKYVGQNVWNTGEVTKTISEAYHKAKADGSNPQLVAVIESILEKNKIENNYANGGLIHSDEDDGKLLFKADTSGGKYSIECRLKDEDDYSIYDYKNGKQTGYNLLSVEEIVVDKLLGSVIGSAVWDNIKYKITVDKLGIAEQIGEASKRYNAISTAEFQEFRTKMDKDKLKELEQKAVSKYEEKLEKDTSKFLRRTDAKMHLVRKYYFNSLLDMYFKK